jgi:hypothetical protein
MNEAKNGRIMIEASVPREYYGRREEIHVDFEELFQIIIAMPDDPQV